MQQSIQNDQQVANQSTSTSHREHPISVLLVEDDCIVRKVMALMLTKLNCQVEVAVDVRSALAMAKEHSYELIFLDIGLPDGSGNDVAAEIRRDEDCPNQVTPIVAVTAHLDIRNVKECELAGINAVLSKPLSEAAAREVIKRFVSSLPIM